MNTHLLRVVGLLLMCLGTGCPVYQDEYSGRYEEQITQEREQCFESRQCNFIAIDFFRFGEFAHAVIREFSKGLRNTIETPFVEETSCVWTRADRFDEESLGFNLPIRKSAPEPGILKGTVVDTELDIQIIEPGSVLFGIEDSRESLRLSLASDDPRPTCQSVNDYLLTAEVARNFPDGTPYKIKNPVFVLLWLGLQRFDSPGGVVYLPTQGPSTWWRLPKGAILNDGKGLSGNVSIQVPPPEEKFLSISGDTRFSLAHLVVADDTDEEGRFNWSVSDEPIVAVGVRPGRPEGEQYKDLDEPAFGKALLFVEDSLLDLDRATQARISNLEAYEFPEQHYFVVDVIADGDEIIELKLPETLAITRPKVPVTAAHLDSRSINLPRLFPFSSQ